MTVRNRLSENNSELNSSPLRRTDRGLATQIDFLTSMVIRVLAIGLLLTAATALIHNAVGVEYTNVVIAERGAARLVDDLLVSSPGDALLNGTCTTSFFRMHTAVCGFDDRWRSEDGRYLNDALAIRDEHLNVTITDFTGGVAVLGGTRLVIGSAIPTSGHTVRTWHRVVGVDVDRNGGVRWYTVTVAVWG